MMRRLFAAVAAPTILLVLWIAFDTFVPDPHANTEPIFHISTRSERTNVIAIVAIYYLFNWAVGALSETFLKLIRSYGAISFVALCTLLVGAFFFFLDKPDLAHFPWVFPTAAAINAAIYAAMVRAPLRRAAAASPKARTAPLKQ